MGNIIGVMLTGVIGIVLSVLGCLLWKRQMTSILHSYHVDKVSPENRKAFCKRSGIGLLLIGAGLLMTALLLGITDSPYSFLCFAASFAAGLFCLITAGMRYNH
ncbi:MAG: DUF3784 domain-containing protein [Blautia sp.]|nr:DUF3784 domain-containing protein [Blautia sp.]